MTQLTSNAIAIFCDRSFSDIEIDSTSSGIYRVWKGMTFIGIVKRCDRTLCWIALSTSNCTEEPYLTSELAIQAVVDAFLLEVA